jgi:hypothetical protein
MKINRFDVKNLISAVQDQVNLHHSLYSAPCKAEYWEELCSKALINVKIGSDWKPDYNHRVGTDQITDCGLRVSNKTGTIKGNELNFSGSRLTKHKTFREKLLFLTEKSEDYVFSLARVKGEWARGIRRYYFCVVDPAIFNFYEDLWGETYGVKNGREGQLVGWFCETEKYSAEIKRGLADQLWTTVKLDACEEVHEINVG